MKKFGFDGDDNTLTSQEARSVVFSPVDLLFRRRVRSSQGVAVAAHVRRRDNIFILTVALCASDKQHPAP